MQRRTRETGNRALYFPEKNFRRKLRVLDELARKREVTPIYSLGRGKTGVVFGGSSEPQHHQR